MTNPNENQNLNTNQQAGGCGCGHHDAKPIDPQRAEVREEIKIVPAEGSVETEGSCGCGHAEGQCQCGHHKTCDCPPGECHCEGHDHGHDHGSDQQYGHADNQVRTVHEAAGHDTNARWNDGIEPAEGGNAEASGAGSSDEGQIN